MNYIEVIIPVTDTAKREQIIAELSLEGYHGFEETPEYLKAYIGEADYSSAQLQLDMSSLGLDWSVSVIPEQNWNQLWESNFEPVTVEAFAGVRASFHAPLENVEHEIIITPKMSFGTGHHATTWMMMRQMKDIDFRGKSVFDFGTGTGILAILAEKLGASEVLAMDHDDWCIANATENIEINGCSAITLMKGDTADVMKPFDIILANINRNIIEANLQYLAKNLVNNGQLLLSGLLESDEAAIRELLLKYRLKHISTSARSGWIAIRCSR
ncbi:MAG TPA: 50S ribosomal protein L11 methyltransferase [Chitinophagaceae bacterium]